MSINFYFTLFNLSLCVFCLEILITWLKYWNEKGAHQPIEQVINYNTDSRALGMRISIISSSDEDKPIKINAKLNTTQKFPQKPASSFA